ncbi:MAG: 16S rRNA (guanine(527)-N(7))-methyltransferase RsmG [Clostridia bacterium]|nr:16S rRNA (guanine(527)-N(7))-methyltransferase RsmG [Clostridia bacterium]
MNSNEIKTRLELNGVPFGADLPEKLYLYLDLLHEWNNRMDLTAVTDDEETVDKHFIDSLIVLKTGLIRGDEKLIDVGTGAGFPGMVLAMACPEMKVTLLDSQQKRLSFLEAVGEESGLKNITLVHDRAEDGARKKELREQFDIAAARAVAPLNVLCEYLLPYVAVEGCALCWKGPALKNELESGRKAAHLLGGRIEMPVEGNVYGREWEHMILPVRKVQHTASTYPRKAGTPKSKPLGL